MRAGWRDSFEDFRMDVEEIIDGGDDVIVMAAPCGTAKDSGAEVRTPTFPLIWTVREGEARRPSSSARRPPLARWLVAGDIRRRFRRNVEIVIRARGHTNQTQRLVRALKSR
jgi:hypothetical protein